MYGAAANTTSALPAPLDCILVVYDAAAGCTQEMRNAPRVTLNKQPAACIILRSMAPVREQSRWPEAGRHGSWRRICQPHPRHDVTGEWL